MPDVAEENGGLSVEEAVQRLEAGAALEDILPALAIERCRFGPTIAETPPEPFVKTSIRGYGPPVAGQLVYTLEQAEEAAKAGRPFIVGLFDYREVDAYREVLPEAYAGFVLRPLPEEGKEWGRTSYSHALVESASLGSSVFDSVEGGALRWGKNSCLVRRSDGSVLEPGQEITIDPGTGRVWDCPLSIRAPSAGAELILQMAIEYLGAEGLGDVIGAQLRRQTEHGHWYVLRKLFPAFSLPGFMRSEPSLPELWARHKGWRDNFSFKSGGTNDFGPLSLGQEELRGDHVSLYRLLDIRAILPFIPEAMAQKIRRGHDHEPGKDAFAFRRRLYAVQLDKLLGRSSFAGHRGLLKEVHKSIIIPSVTNRAEVQAFKRLVRRKAAPVGIAGLLGFGVMIETMGAVENIEAIARECGVLCFGTNDLTAAITGRSREDLSYEGWRILVPEVRDVVRESIAKAKAANPNVRICLVGHQTSGHDVGSIKAAWGMGVDTIFFTLTPEDVARGALAIAQAHAESKAPHPVQRLGRGVEARAGIEPA